VPATGKPQIYDMDNTNDPKERPAFEQLYGKLPACVPGSGTVPAVIKSAGRAVTNHAADDRSTISSTDTVPRTQHEVVVHMDSSSVRMDLKKALWLVDGVERPGYTKDSIAPENIASMSLISPADAFKLFGEKGINGVVGVLTTTYSAKHKYLPPATQAYILPKREPVIILDGVRLPDSVRLNSVPPNGIESINVLKDEASAGKYGADAAKRGVILVTTKTAKKQP
jgi:TonB-dependent SusC/RagA subfamily outer membrane receptor